jgi:hypothetical protein
MEDAQKRNKRQYQWQAENKDRINFTMPKGRKEKIKEAAQAEGISASEWINAAITEKLDGSVIHIVKAPAAKPGTVDLSDVKDLAAYAMSAHVSVDEYVRQAVKDRMTRQDQDYTDDSESVADPLIW